MALAPPAVLDITVLYATSYVVYVPEVIAAKALLELALASAPQDSSFLLPPAHVSLTHATLVIMEPIVHFVLHAMGAPVMMVLLVLVNASAHLVSNSLPVPILVSVFPAMA